MTLVRRCLELGILTCRFLSCKLFGSWRHFLGVRRSSLLFGSRLRFHTIGTVKAGAAGVHLFVHRPIDERVMNDSGVHVCHGSVIKEPVSLPAAAPVPGAEVAKAVVNATVKTDGRSPVALIKGVNAVVPTPPGWSPKQTYCGRRHPDAGHPVIIGTAPAPVTGSPDIAFDRSGRLSKVDRYAYLCERRQRQREKYKSSQNQGT